MTRREQTYQLMELAEKYETAEFLNDDPAKFMHRFIRPADIEVMGFIAANLAFGQRPQILQKLEFICSQMDGSPALWIANKGYEQSFPNTGAKFYRFFSYGQMRTFFEAIGEMLSEGGSIGDYLHQQYDKGISPLEALIAHFSKFETGHIVPINISSSCKRLNMFLRWMVRDNSPVDMGLWTWYDKKNLIIPVDTHVMQEAMRLGIIKRGNSTMKTALEITRSMGKIWPSDPCRGDFALFGMGIHP